MMKGALGLIGLGLLALSTIVTSQCVGILNCDNCDNPGPRCYECNTGKFLKTTGTETTCAGCPDNCASCTDETTCDACLPRYMKDSTGACVSCGTHCAECTIDANDVITCTKCDTRKYVASGNCESCPSNCDACSSSSCSKCASDFVKNSNSEATDNKKCLACPDGCTTCSGTELSGAATCTACDDDKYLLSGRCPACLDTNCATCKDDGSCEVDGCNSRFYKKDPQLSCQACSPAASCITCDLEAGSTTETECSVCKEDYGLNTEAICEACDDSNCEICNGDTGICTGCKEKYAVVSGGCTACGEHCDTCVANSGNNGVICTLCDDTDYIPDSVTGACVVRECADANCATCLSRPTCTVCNANYYLDSGGACVVNTDCDSTCLTCDGAAATDCVTCPAGQGVSSSTGACVDCDSTCTTCDGTAATNCLTCPATKGLTSSGTCVACDTSCATCEGTAATNCLTCPATKGLTTSGTCVACDSSCATCDAGTAGDCLTCVAGKGVSSGSCVVCDGTCLTCDGTTNADCLTCAAGKGLSSGACVVCHGDCATCDSTAADHCKSCSASGKHVYDPSSAGYGPCIACHTSCATCSADNDAATCLTCAVGYTAGPGGTCIVCHASCLTCHTANNPNACLTCNAADRYFFTVVTALTSTGTCTRCQTGCNECDTEAVTTKCDAGECDPNGYVQAAVSGACLACPAHCDTCTEESTDVTICSANGCSDGYYLKDSVCTDCPPHCETCAEDAAGNLVCSVCLDSFKLSTDQCAECPNDCDECTLENYAMKCTKCAEYKAMDSENACRSCPGQCSECSVSGDVVKCKAGKCAAGYGLSADSTSCDDCVTLTGVDSCATCQDSNSTGYSQCMSCEAGKFLKDDFSECLDRFDSCAKSEDRPNECTQCSEGFNVTEDRQCSLTCYTCEGEDCNKAGSPGVSDVCVGNCWVYYNDVDGTATVTRGCENKICPEDNQEEHCKEVNNNGTGSAVTKECEQCCTTNDCNTQILDGVDGDNGSRNLQYSTWLLLAGIIALLTR